MVEMCARHSARFISSYFSDSSDENAPPERFHLRPPSCEISAPRESFVGTEQGTYVGVGILIPSTYCVYAVVASVGPTRRGEVCSPVDILLWSGNVLVNNPHDFVKSYAFA